MSNWQSGIKMPPTWPPFTRSTWDDRARSFLESLSRMGREDELYPSVPMALNGSEGELRRVRGLAVPSSLAAAGTEGGGTDGAGEADEAGSGAAPDGKDGASPEPVRSDGTDGADGPSAPKPDAAESSGGGADPAGEDAKPAAAERQEDAKPAAAASDPGPPTSAPIKAEPPEPEPGVSELVARAAAAAAARDSGLPDETESGEDEEEAAEAETKEGGDATVKGEADPAGATKDDPTKDEPAGPAKAEVKTEGEVGEPAPAEDEEGADNKPAASAAGPETGPKDDGGAGGGANPEPGGPDVAGKPDPGPETPAAGGDGGPSPPLEEAGASSAGPPDPAPSAAAQAPSPPVRSSPRAAAAAASRKLAELAAPRPSPARSQPGEVKSANPTSDARSPAAVGAGEESRPPSRPSPPGSRTPAASPPKKRARVLHTYKQRRRYIVDTLNLLRHVVGGGRSGRRGRAEAVAFYRHCIEMLDGEYEAAVAEADADELGDVSEVEDLEGFSDGVAGEDEGGEDDEEDEDGGSEAGETGEDEYGEDGGSDEDYTTDGSYDLDSSGSVIVCANEQDFLDQHNDYCEVCNQPGELLCCATCNLVYHKECVRPRLAKDPPDDWKCAYCVSSGVVGGKREGKERRRATNACREMERMKESIKAGTLDPPVGIIKLSDLNRADSDDGDGVRLAPQDVPLEDAAASGCRKCINELETGEKDRRMHDNQCPRKFGKRERNARMRLGRKGASASAAARAAGATDDRVPKKKRKRDRPPPPFAAWAGTCPPAGRAASPDDDDAERRRWAPPASLEDAARAGCTKCRLELDTGEKTRRAHSDDCPRKFPRQRGGGAEPSPPPEARAKDDRPRKKKGRPAGTSSTDANNGRALPPNYVVPLEKAAESGCRKCRLELETGEKTRQSHDERCPRKWRPKEGSAGSTKAAAVGARDGSGKFRPATKPVAKKKRKRDRKAERERRLAREAAARANEDGADTDDEEAANMLAEGIGTADDERPRKKRKRDKDRKRKRDRKQSSTRPSGSPFWSEHLIEEFVRLRREKFGNANAWTEIAALMPPKPEGYGRWTAQELANMWHLGNSSVKRFCRKDGKLNAIKNCVSDKTGDWLADYKKKK